MSGHTPGPWKVVRHHHVHGELWLSVNAATRSDGGYQWIAEIRHLTTGEAEQLANAHLIAAAPAMLEALEEITELLSAARDCGLKVGETELLNARTALKALSDEPHPLESRTITGIKIADDQKALLFQTTAGDVIARTDGDCCSNSWVEHVELPAMGFPAVVLKVADLELPQPTKQEDEYEVVAVYGYKITTDKGDITIDFRNSSNGYYGGNLAWPGEDFYGGVYGQNVSTEKWVEVKGGTNA